MHMHVDAWSTHDIAKGSHNSQAVPKVKMVNAAAALDFPTVFDTELAGKH